MYITDLRGNSGDAFIARQESTNSSFSVPIFSKSRYHQLRLSILTSMPTAANASTTWVANPNTTDTGPNSTFSNAVFFVPGPDSSSRQVGFLASNSTPTDDVTSGFTFYGHVAILVDSAGAWQTLFYAIPTSSNGIWSLNWNTTDEDDAIPVTLKDSAPPHIPPAANATP